MKPIIFSLLVAIAFSCQPYKREIPTGPPVAIDNVYTQPNYDYPQLVNVLVLPIENQEDNPFVTQHEAKIRKSFLMNFNKFNYFKVFEDRSSDLETSTVIDVETNRINKALLGALGDQYNVQGVMQISVVEFSPFFPMHMTVRASLFDANRAERVWSIDQVFDASDAEVINAIRLWWNDRKAGGTHARFDDRIVEPKLFFDYVFYSVAESYGRSRMGNISAESKYEEVAESRRPLPKSVIKD